MAKESRIIDEKDRKILVELDKNARQADSAIAKRVGLTKQVVNYRIAKMLENGIINNFYTIVDLGGFGLNTYYIFLQLENINDENEIKVLEKIEDLDYVGWLVAGMGRWDAVILVNSESIAHFEKCLNEIMQICGKNLHEYIFVTMVGSEHIGYKLLGSMGSSEIKQSEKKRLETPIVDKTDIKILKAISQNSRISIVEISEKTKLPLHVVNYHLKNLIKNKIIEGFKPKIDMHKLGYQWHLLLIRFRTVEEKRKKEFLNFCKNHKNIYFVTNTIGNYNLMLDIHVNTIEEFKKVLLEIKDKYSDLIKVYESMVIFEEHKISYLPKSVLKD